ncbi:AEC family transporter [Negadavirga shengliensis]|uniref:AEC family transporter n=1 Tax=Negadavirga shengliensis TaxID=1389218 RepID=A0ABV9SYP9_9BACT
MTNISLIAVSILIGILLQKLKDFPADAPRTLNAYLIYVVLPAVSLLHISKIDITLALLLPISVAWITFTFTWIFFGYLGKKFNWKRNTIGCLIICGGLSNTGFVGYPVIEAIFGAEGLKIAILVDQPGSFIVVSSLAIVVASIYGAEKMRKRDISKKMLLFPPFLFFLFAIILNLLNMPVSGMAESILQSLAGTLTPIALIAVGMQLKIRTNDIKDHYLWYGLAHKLFLAPLLIYLIYGMIIGNNPAEQLIYKVSVMEAAMAPMITSSIIASSYNLRPKMASLLVGLGIPISLFTLAFWYYVLKFTL